jgi:hypothetical protein
MGMERGKEERKIAAAASRHLLLHSGSTAPLGSKESLLHLHQRIPPPRPWWLKRARLEIGTMDKMEEEGGSGAAGGVKAGGLNIDIHPLVIINISDHTTRKRSLAKGKATRVLGILLGIQVGLPPPIFPHVSISPSLTLCHQPPACLCTPHLALGSCSC